MTENGKWKRWELMKIAVYYRLCLGDTCPGTIMSGCYLSGYSGVEAPDVRLAWVMPGWHHLSWATSQTLFGEYSLQLNICLGKGFIYQNIFGMFNWLHQTVRIVSKKHFA